MHGVRQDRPALGDLCLRDFRPCPVLDAAHITVNKLTSKARTNHLHAAITRPPYPSNPPSHIQHFREMSTQDTRKRKSDRMDHGPSTPTGSPAKKIKITQTQKQALIDNLQLESKISHGQRVWTMLTGRKSRRERDSFELITRYNARI